MSQAEVFVARQPIFDRERRVVAYELLFRRGLEQAAVFVDGNRATEDVVGHGSLTIGLDRLTGGRPAFINFPRDLLLRGTADLLPQKLVVIEILEDVRPEPEVMESLRSLKERDYTLALDDFVCSGGNEAFLDVVDILKFEFPAMGREERAQEISQVRKRSRRQIRLLAEKVEEYAQFREAVDQGFDLFQGYFFSRPEVITGTVIPGHRLAYLRILQALGNPELDYTELESVIKTDVSLTTKLLRFINAAAFPWSREIVSLRQALVLLGEDQVRRWVGLVMISEFAAGKPRELSVLCSVRGRLCEHISRMVPGVLPLRAFLTGTLSLLDALLNVRMEDALRQVPLQEDARAALEGRDSPLRTVLDLVVAYEEGDWHKVGELSRLLGVPEEALAPLYVESLEWTRKVFGQAD